MATAVKTKSTGNAEINKGSAVREVPKRLSKFGQWRLDNPGGLFYVKDRRAINRMRY
jgi:hypothetical protein